MSIANLFSRNNSELYCKSLTASELVTNNLTCQEYPIDTLQICNGTTNIFLNSSVNLKYSYNGVCTFFNDTNTLNSQIMGTSTPDIKLRTFTNSYDIEGFPEIRGVIGIEYISNIYCSVNGIFTPAVLILRKASASAVNISIYKLDGMDFGAIDTISLLPFLFSYNTIPI